jgi:hypothetical protein
MTKAAKIKEEFTDPDLIGVDFNNLKRKADVDTAPKPRKRARKTVEKAKEDDGMPLVNLPLEDSTKEPPLDESVPIKEDETFDSYF